MTHDPNDIVKIAAGTLVEMNLLKDELENAGIFGRVVGGDLTAGLGNALTGSVELWVHASEVARAEKIMARDEEHSHKQGCARNTKNSRAPESDPKPDKSQSPHRTPEPHRPSP